MDLDLGLGQSQEYVDHYSPELLRSIPRVLSRSQLSLPEAMYGADVWTAYEISWLDSTGKPNVAIGEIRVPADSPNIIESKSLKYYLNSFNQQTLDSVDALRATLESDLSDRAGATVGVQIFSLEQYDSIMKQSAFDVGELIDHLPLDDLDYEPSDSLLQVNHGETVSREKVVRSHLLKSNCPVTGQPDWATVWIGYTGAMIVPESLLKYIVSFRQHQDFHENCVERMFTDISARCTPQSLWVYARYTRRGGLDINPFRSSQPQSLPRLRGVRQ